MTDEQREPFDKRQRAYFDKRAELFLNPIPQAVQDRTRAIVEAAGLDELSKILDVGTGAGVLLHYFVDQGVDEANIIGCDLSPGMTANAKRKFPRAYFWNGDILDFPIDLSKRANLPPDFPKHIYSFDAVFFNACFGNIFNQKEALARTAGLLSTGGAIIISHPMGAKFVAALNKGEPEIVPHLLPDLETLQELVKSLPLKIEQYRDEDELYLAVLRRKQ